MYASSGELIFHPEAKEDSEITQVVESQPRALNKAEPEARPPSKLPFSEDQHFGRSLEEHELESALSNAGFPVPMERQQAMDSPDQHTDLSGYPALANDLCKPEHMIFRTFKNSRMRMLLWQQFNIASLEKRLQSLDQEDNQQRPLWIQEKDKNEARKGSLSNSKLLLRNMSVRSAPKSTRYRTARVQYIAGELMGPEKDYLDKDLMDIGGTSDPQMGKIPIFTESLVKILLELELAVRERCFGERGIERLSMTTTNFMALAHAIVASLAVAILFLPILILNFVQSSGMRLLVVFISDAVFTSTLMMLNPAVSSDVFVAGATYCAVFGGLRFPNRGKWVAFLRQQLKTTTGRDGSLNFGVGYGGLRPSNTVRPEMVRDSVKL
ncbi:hypothetical protein IWX90DRAFT_498368 [Phyllosticta citrichinensis]|uniref:DUF6594 domain-containing protein n=1 Tax=Phyllosticta citrichinensis TaxID=1130410 RepID=A0ABR1Y4D1_9PEZI